MSNFPGNSSAHNRAYAEPALSTNAETLFVRAAFMIVMATTMLYFNAQNANNHFVLHWDIVLVASNYTPSPGI